MPRILKSLICRCIFGFGAILMLQMLNIQIVIAQIRLVKNINTHQQSSFPEYKGVSNYAILNNQVIFQGNDWKSGPELWISDGTKAGTKLLKELVTSHTGSQFGHPSPHNFITFGNKVFFAAGTPQNHVELWVTDGTAAGTYQFKEFNLAPQQGSFPNNFFIWNNQLFFRANGRLYRTDGTPDGTILLGASNPYSFVEHNGKLYFLSGGNLWETNGSVVGTKALTTSLSGSQYLTIFNNKFYFVSSGKLVMSDGTDAGTQVVKDINASDLIVYNNQLFFIGYDASVRAMRLWVTDGTAVGTQKLKEIEPKNTSDLFPQKPKLIASSQGLLVRAKDATNGNEIWITNGTDASTQLLKDINPGALNSDPVFLGAYNNHVYFSAIDGSHGREIWRTDGTAANTHLIKDIRGGKLSSNPIDFFVLNNLVYFQAHDGIHGEELWATDGTAAGTQLITDINQVPVSSYPRDFGVSQNKLYFSANDNDHGRETWVSDGTSTGTHFVRNVITDKREATRGHANPQFFTEYNNQTFFVVEDKFRDYSLWVTDDTEAGTTLIHDNFESKPNSLKVVNGKLFFRAESQRRNHWWIIDHTTGNLNPVKLPLTRFDNIQKEVGDYLFFSNGYYNQKTDTYGGDGRYITFKDKLMLFKKDGLWILDEANVPNATLVKAIDGSLTNFTLVNDKFRFFARKQTGTSNEYWELWESDGTSGGTTKISDLALPKKDGVIPGFHKTLIGQDKIFIISQESRFDFGLWSIDVTTGKPQQLIKMMSWDQDADVALMGKRFYFVAEVWMAPSAGYELWCSDGTLSGTVLVQDLKAGTKDAFLRGEASMKVFKNQLFLGADNGSVGQELYAYTVPTNQPLITDFSPKQGVSGTEVTITGQNFRSIAEENNVKFNGIKAKVITASGTSLKVIVPLGATTGKITIDYFGVAAESANDFTVEPSHAVTGFSPKIGAPGDVVTITGTNFDPVDARNIVKFNGVQATVTNGNLTELQVTVPEGVTSGKITVEKNRLIATSSEDFEPAPFILDFFPRKGKAKDTIIITGSHFDAIAANNIVRFNGTKATIISTTTQRLEVIVPANATTGKVSVERKGHQTSAKEDFEVIGGTPTGLPETLQKGTITLFPNPTDEILYFQLKGNPTKQVTIAVYNLRGQVMLQTTQRLQQGKAIISMQGLSAGKYTLTIKVNEDVITRSIIKN